MTYLAIARKYRPQTFDAVIAQEPIVQTLKNAIQQNLVAHAYIFSGMRGVGKTTTARILAKALNCQKGPTVTPCGECPPCLEIAAGTAMDVLEIDAASNRGIDEIRELRENVRYLPARDRYKVFIIDEAHMLTAEAFNALLKTLEEPPERVIFILATTEAHRIPSTIHSRCQSFHFRSVSFEEILSVLERVAKQEGIQADAEALAVMTRAAEGSLRDALSILDQAIAYCAGKVEAPKVRELLGVVSEDVLERLVEAIRAQSAEDVLKLVDELVRDGHNLQHFCREVLRHIRNLLLVRVGGPAAALVEATGAERAHLEAAASVFREEDLLRFFNTLMRADGELRWSPHPRLHLELALLKLVQAERLASVEEILAELSGATSTPRPAAVSSTPARAAAVASAAPVQSKPAAARASEPSGGPGSNLSSSTIDSIKSAVYARSKMLGSFVENAAAWERDKETLTLWFAPEDRSLSEMLGRKQLNDLEAIVSEVLGEPTKVLPRVRPATAAPAQEPPPPAADPRLQNPVVQALLERFGGTLRTASELPRRKGQE
ncbi:MAG TPA: DNA polymerase III subunit gamma/tau [Candidatus Xenobia bacterium]|nr:DNA polymerase III subunit gamma/tau [Candidatus Xenobia bacterium]